MAAAEARAVWQRTANRCFVQEDAKRAPKLACCQSSSSSSKQLDGGPTSAADMPDQSSGGFMPLRRYPSYSSLPPDTRWWLQLQPSYGYKKCFTLEQLNALEAELESLRADIVDSPSKSKFCQQDDTDSVFVDGSKNSESSLDSCCMIPADYVMKDHDVKKEELKVLYDKDFQEFKNSKSTEMEPTGWPKSQKDNAYGFDPESAWIGGEKNMPWWRVTDKDDLASLVAQKSLDYITNCDLPPPQKMNIGKYPCARPGSFQHDNTPASSLDWKEQSGCISSATDPVQGCPEFEGMPGKQRASTDRLSQSDSDKACSFTKTNMETAEIGLVSQGDPCKAQLLEALRHSQTRAREAEKVAKQACAEKENTIKLFFKQASQLFAYKQWFQLLQLETLYYQMKNSDQPMSNIFPVVLPWIPRKGRKLRKSWQKSSKGKRGKRCRPKHDIGTYAVAFALGLSLVGAGLLLGWTVGWMLPF
ncbi:uncharacterized protein LOC133682503 [Populus nigra]|uniref:uncharacterized protein LOC133682503 n=1 Tax=Populus nigra TaxID=3691 RepID=UPI002B267BEF|nr:uncharacterized protein LOC133682503 [Populus nigra]XP_061961844.1 uncharacterized protein LOC133682503 [Populus nigra]